MPRTGIQVGKVSEQTGLSVGAIRFYEKQRLLERAGRTEGGFASFIPKIFNEFSSSDALNNSGFHSRKSGNCSLCNATMARPVPMSTIC